MDYVSLLYHLLPRGQIWPQTPGDAPTLDALLQALAAEPARIEADAERIASIWVDLPDECLEDFERILSLSPAGLSNTQRRAQIAARLAAIGSDISLPDMQGIADTFELGAVLTEGDYPLFVMGDAMGSPLRGDQWAASYTVTYPGPSNTAFEAAMRAVTPPQNSVIFVVT